MKKDIYKKIEDVVRSLKIDEAGKRALFLSISRLKKERVNLLITGATGSGKSSTINAMFELEVAKVGVGSDPETMNIQKYELDQLTLWDSPGLGDGIENDKKHAKGIINKLQEVDLNGNPLIDLVLVILDGGSRDLGTSYELINQVIIPQLGHKASDRILIAINQADVAMKGRNWDLESNQPEPKLVTFLDEKVRSVKNRIKSETGIDLDPIYYCAGYKDGDESQIPWNLSKLLYFIVKHTPCEKRLAYIDQISNNKETWQKSDNKEEYGKETQRAFADVAKSFGKNVAAGAAVGAAIGSVIPVIGTAIGSAVGAFCGGVASFFGF